MIKAADRVLNMQKYIFDEIADMKRNDPRDPSTFIDLSIGNPDRRPHPKVIELIKKQLDTMQFQNHRYSTFDGTAEMREAVANWYQRRWGVTLNPKNEVLPLIGSKEGIAKLLLAYMNPGDTLIVGTPCYPAYLGAAKIAQCRVVELPLRAENGFLPDFSDISDEDYDKAKFVMLNYPSNPTGAVCELDTYREALRLAEKHDFIVTSDVAYSELALEPGCPTPSFMELEGGVERGLEFHSFSKSYNMAGWRIGWVVGNPEILRNLVKVKANMDFSAFMAVQRTGADILNLKEDLAAEQREAYRHRRDILVEGFGQLGWKLTPPRAAMYIWDRVPSRYTDAYEFVKDFFKATGVIVSPGIAFGAHTGEFMRMSMVVDDDGINDMFERVKSSGFAFD